MSEQTAGGERRVHWFRQMVEIRLFEDKVQELFMGGHIQGTTHLCQGQEAVSVGAIAAMQPGDVQTNTYRGHGEALALGMAPEVAFAELMGRATGCSRGLGGSMHLIDTAKGNIGANAIVGAGMPIAVGAAMAFKLRREPHVAMSFFGDGATNIGTFHEALNLAQLWQVPAVFVCENNHWAESTPASQQLPIEDLSKRAVAFGMHSITVDGQDVEAVHKAAARALKHARDGKGPVFLLANTYRLVGHYIGDPQVYRDKEELQQTRETQDPIDKLRERLEISEADFEELDREAHELVEASVEFAKAGTDPKPEDALKNVYA
jgi:pyruvate dehydrogenase E1 component alpha subunit